VILKSAKGTWTGAATITYAYQWQRCDTSGAGCANIALATKAFYRVTHGDVGHTLRVTVTATNGAGSSSATSNQTAVVVAAAPVKKTVPKISGTLEDGQLLTVSNATWKGTPPLSFTYQGQVCTSATSCSIISGATASSYRPITSQIGRSLRAVVTASNTVGAGSATSGLTKKIKAGPPVDVALPTISGTLQEAGTLTATTGTWVGTGPFTYTYQWQRCNVTGGGCKDIAGATSSTYTLTTADVASNLDVVVTASNALGSAAATSVETQPVAATLPSNNVLPTITGLLQDGQLLSVATGTWEGTAPITYSYQWQLCNALGAACQAISGATGSSLKLSPADVGSTLAVVVTATNAAGSAQATAPLTSVIGALLPSNTALPNVSGTLIDGSSLTSTTGTWSGTSPTYSYQWLLCNSSGASCKEISGAVGSALSLVAADIGSTVRMVVTATNSAGSTSATSEPTGVIAALLPKNTALPSISGTPEDGQLLSAATGSWQGTSPTYSYQWQLCNNKGEACSNLSGAVGSALSLAAADVGSTLRVVVTATNSAGSTSATSSATNPILAILPKNTALPSISGVLKLEKPLSATTGTWSGTEPITYGYQWQLCNALKQATSCANISEATSSTFLLKLLDVGNTLRVGVTATNTRGSVQVFSAITGLIEGLLLAPSSGPSGTSVTLTGSGVSAATAVNFGSAEVSEVEVKSPSEITVQAPAGAGKVPVTVTVPEGSTGANPKDMFTYN
jgi:hypothetical protein